MTPPADRPIPHADFETPDLVAARGSVLVARTAAWHRFTAENAKRLEDAWVSYDNLLYDAGRASAVPAHDDTALLLKVLFRFSTVPYNPSATWYSAGSVATLKDVAAVLLKRGVLEKHPTMDWYRLSPTKEAPNEPA